MKTKTFDCVEMKRKAAAPINERLKGMTVGEQIAYWQARTIAFEKEYGAQPKEPAAPKSAAHPG